MNMRSVNNNEKGEGRSSGCDSLPSFCDSMQIPEYVVRRGSNHQGDSNCFVEENEQHEDEYEKTGQVCSLCGHGGIRKYLFKCLSCSRRFQHTYCSNLYPYKLDISICNWCQPLNLGLTSDAEDDLDHTSLNISSCKERLMMSSCQTNNKCRAFDYLLQVIGELGDDGCIQQTAAAEDHVNRLRSSNSQNRKFGTLHAACHCAVLLQNEERENNESLCISARRAEKLMKSSTPVIISSKRSHSEVECSCLQVRVRGSGTCECPQKIRKSANRITRICEHTTEPCSALKLGRQSQESVLGRNTPENITAKGSEYARERELHSAHCRRNGHLKKQVLDCGVGEGLNAYRKRNLHPKESTILKYNSTRAINRRFKLLADVLC
ncbi:hypothetical protein KP509_04G108000 [Ceratopteris richardii]|uniref:PHD-type zinc finger plants domain-containing protein n=1 Tax=Ceratopteris richardii TaxID=49495 RepID=A0A8T2V3E7_CERRI|nr:hypothetical protein KP509_04G108000 [Ceratopteris richardii]